MVTPELMQPAGFPCEHGSDCPCPVLEIIDGKILFVGTPSKECHDTIAYAGGRVCTCVRRNQRLSLPN